MLYVILGRDAAASLPIRRQVRAAHLERVEALRDAGRLVVAGPMPAVDGPDPGPAGFHGSVIVAEFADLDEARAWASADPYVTDGVFESVEVRPFVQVLP